MKIALLIVAFTACTACSSIPKKGQNHVPASAVTQEAQQLASHIAADEVTEIEFPSDSAELTTLSERLLKQSLQKALEKGPVERIAVVTWGDEQYPSADQPRLSKEQRQLALARNYAIKQYLQQFDAKPLIRVYSMAERPGFFDKMIGNKEWKIKRALEQENKDHEQKEAQTSARISKSVILFKNSSKKKN